MKDIEKSTSKKDKYTFTRSLNLFGEEVVMIFRNSDKKHIVSIGEDHVKDIMEKGFCPYNEEGLTAYIKHYGYDL